MALTWQGKVVLLGILGFVAYSVMGTGAGNREIERRAALGACGLATEYIEWRVDFDATLNGATHIKGRELNTFLKESGLFSRASTRLSGNGESAQPNVLRQLNLVTTHDARRSESDTASTGPFLEAFFNDCSADAAVLALRYGL